MVLKTNVLKIPTRIKDTNQIVKGDINDNSQKQSFTPSINDNLYEGAKSEI